MLGLSSLLQHGSRSARGRRPTAHLICLHPDTGDRISSANSELSLPSIFYFQYYPETISDSKSSTIGSKEIPGASLPIHNWTGSSDRVISFESVFTTDTDLSENKPSIGNISIDTSLVSRQRSAQVDRRNIDIRVALAHLRSLMTPKYSLVEDRFYTSAPPTLLLSIPGSGIGMIGGGYFSGDTILCYLQKCDITMESFFPSGFPRVAVASLSFTETAQMPGHPVYFPDRSRSLIGFSNPNAYNAYIFNAPDKENGT